MSKQIIRLSLILSLFITVACQKDKKIIRIIPEPVSVKSQVGRFHFTGVISLEANSPQLEWCRAYLMSKIEKAPGVEWIEHQLSGGKKVVLSLDDKTDELLGEEGYHLVVNPRSIIIQARSPQGIFYGVQTLLQLMDPVVYSTQGLGENSLIIPCADIIDYPRFQWRGYMLDVSRHFFQKEFIYQVIDNLALHKLNTLHLHLLDDQGWRIEIKQYPKLTETGAWRADREHLHWNARGGEVSPDEAIYGGFYTQEEIRDIVQYAADHFITVVPEIEMPAHVSSAIASYPFLSCKGAPISVPSGGVWPITDIYCAGKESTFQFLENVLIEVMDLFPSKYIHIGGDEATKTAWTTCPNCQKRIREEGLENTEELQSYFIQRMERFLNAHGRNLIGWDEILEGGLAPNAAVMSWRGIQGGIEAANAGHPVVMSPTSFCYFDYYQGDPDLEPLAIGGFLPLEQVYSYEPVPEEITGEKIDLILGAQANLWTEYISNPSQAEYMTYPRLCALAEVVWSPKEKRDLTGFMERLSSHLERLSAKGINYSKSFANVRVLTTNENPNEGFEVALDCFFKPATIKYTLDGSAPTFSSLEYTKPFAIDQTTTIKAAAFLNNQLYSVISTEKLWIHLASGASVSFQQPYSPKYNGGGDGALTNSQRGSINQSDGYWLGFEGNDLDVVIDLGVEKEISRVMVGCLQSVGSWIFFPKQLQIKVSDNGETYSDFGELNNSISSQDPVRQIQNLQVESAPVKVRYLQVKAINMGVCPDWHAGAGNKAWIFIDEIVVE